MFKKFSPEESVSSTSQVKNSVTRGIQSGIIEQFPDLEDAIETLMPKKSMTLAKCQDHLQVILSNGEPIFYNKRDGPYFPTLRLVHKHPTFMKRMQVDKGAVFKILVLPPLASLPTKRHQKHTCFLALST